MDIHLDAKQVRLPNGLIGWIVEVSAPIEGPMTGRSVISNKSHSPLPGPAGKLDAVHKAVSIVDEMASNPVIAALMPPGTAAAVALTKEIARGMSDGSIAHVVDKYGGIASQAYQQVKRFSHWLHL